MINVSDVQRLLGMSFHSYLLTPGNSFSFLKNEINGIALPIKETDKVKLGKMVDAIITGGEIDISDKMFPHAKEIAYFLRKNFGYCIDNMDKQVSYSGTFEYKGFFMRVKGRPDFELKNQLIVDLKITGTRNVDSVIKFMRYEDQLFGYGKLAGVKKSYILIYSTVTKTCKLVYIPVGDTNPFWCEKILKFGKIAV